MSRVLVVTGMHRSGTSLVANYLHACGVHLGDRLLGRNDSNPRGHYEDLEILDFHQGILDRHGLTPYLTRRDLPLAIGEQDRRAAGEIVARRLAGEHAVWGWKDPRTALFLDLWREMLPDAHFIFLFRHPFAVLDSLLRRADPEIHASPELGLETWRAYNEPLLAFAQRHPRRCLLVEIETVVEDPAILARRLPAGFGIDPDPERFRSVFVEPELRPTPALRPPGLWYRRPRTVFGALLLHHRLRRSARSRTPPRTEARGVGPPAGEAQPRAGSEARRSGAGASRHLQANGTRDRGGPPAPESGASGPESGA